MASSTISSTVAKNEAVMKALAAPISSEKKVQNDAEKDKGETTKNLKNTLKDLNEVSNSITKSRKYLKELDAVKSSFDNVNRAGNFASALAANTSGADLAKSITDAAKSVKAALASVELTYPEATAMKARVNNVDIYNDTDITKDKVALYTECTEAAADLTELWKNNAIETALVNSSFLKIDVEGNLERIADLTKAIEALGKDIDATIASEQALLDADVEQANDLNKKIEGLDLEILQLDLIINAADDFIDYSKPTPLISLSKTTSKKK